MIIPKWHIILRHLAVYLHTCFFCGTALAIIFSISTLLKGEFGFFFILFLGSLGTALLLTFIPYLICITIVKKIIKKNNASIYILMGAICGIISPIPLFIDQKDKALFLFVILGFVGLIAGYGYYRLEKIFFKSNKVNFSEQ